MGTASHVLVGAASFQAKAFASASQGTGRAMSRSAPSDRHSLGVGRRWVVERTFSWFGRNRRLAKDYENLANTLAAFVTLAAIQFAIRRLARM